MFKRAWFAFSMSLCASAFAADAPKWLTEAHSRESKPLTAMDLQSKDGWFKAQLPGKVVGAIEKIEGSYPMELDIGSDTNVFCEVFPEGIDLANTLRATLDTSLESIKASQGKLAARALESLDAGSYGPVPYISLSWLYRVAGPDGPQVGALKQVVMVKDGTAIYCIHNELGYKRTFANLAQAFAESLVSQLPPGAPHYQEISVASMSGSEVGVTLSRLEREADGVTRALQLTALFVATDDGKIQAHDSRHTNWIRADGTLVNSVSNEFTNGEVSESLELKRTEGGGWSVQGEVQGKAVKTSLPKGSEPGNWIAQAHRLRAMMAESNPVGREYSMDIWISENPEKLTVVKTKILAKQDDAHFTAQGKIGAIAASFVLEKASGMATSADARVGPITMKLERIYVSGSF